MPPKRDPTTTAYQTVSAREESYRNARIIGTNARSRTAKNFSSWPHQSPAPATMAKRGLFYAPSKEQLDRVQCYLCGESFNGWEPSDDPAIEHAELSPDCPLTTIDSARLFLDETGATTLRGTPFDPHTTAAYEARMATLVYNWPHQRKRGWRPTAAAVAQAGLYYAPQVPGDDTVECALCGTSLSDWEREDDPLRAHRRQSPGCIFFTCMPNENAATATPGKKRQIPRALQKTVESSPFTALDHAALQRDLPGPPKLQFPAKIDAANTGTKRVGSRRVPAPVEPAEPAAPVEPSALAEPAATAEPAAEVTVDAEPEPVLEAEIIDRQDSTSDASADVFVSAMDIDEPKHAEDMDNMDPEFQPDEEPVEPESVEPEHVKHVGLEPIEKPEDLHPAHVEEEDVEEPVESPELSRGRKRQSDGPDSARKRHAVPLDDFGNDSSNITIRANRSVMSVRQSAIAYQESTPAFSRFLNDSIVEPRFKAPTLNVGAGSVPKPSHEPVLADLSSDSEAESESGSAESGSVDSESESESESEENEADADAMHISPPVTSQSESLQFVSVTTESAASKKLADPGDTDGANGTASPRPLADGEQPSEAKRSFLSAWLHSTPSFLGTLSPRRLLGSMRGTLNSPLAVQDDRGSLADRSYLSLNRGDPRDRPNAEYINTPILGDVSTVGSFARSLEPSNPDVTVVNRTHVAEPGEDVPGEELYEKPVPEPEEPVLEPVELEETEEPKKQHADPTLSEVDFDSERDDMDLDAPSLGDSSHEEPVEPAEQNEPVSLVLPGLDDILAGMEGLAPEVQQRLAKYGMANSHSDFLDAVADAVEAVIRSNTQRLVDTLNSQRQAAIEAIERL